MARRLVLSILSLVAISAPLGAQSSREAGRGITLSAAFGPSTAARGVDASGAHGDVGIGYRSHSNGWGIVLEMAGHRYRDVPLYPCLVQDADRCYQTMRRRVSATIGSITYNLPTQLIASHDAGAYLLAGIGSYGSRRVATRYPDCQPTGVCDRATYTLELRDRQIGASGGIGAEMRFDHVLVFAELRVHYAYRNTPRGTPSNDYFLVPLSVGLRL
jgi:hypothetical protein